MTNEQKTLLFKTVNFLFIVLKAHMNIYIFHKIIDVVLET